MLRSANRFRTRLALPVALLLLAGAFVAAFTLKTIVIDGDVSDWDDILVDSENAVADAAAFSDPPDPDAPGTADRDMRAFAVTWDTDRLYFFLRRTLSGNNSFTFLVYVDTDHNELLESTDFVAAFDYNGAAFQSGTLYEYVPAAPGGDPITGDGQDEPGSAGAPVPATDLQGGDSPDGIEFETSLPWADLGVAPGSCLWFHASVSTGTNLPGQVQDNADAIDGQYTGIELTEDHIGTAPSPGTIRYAHRVCHQGNCADTLDLSLESSQGWTARIYSDPNGDGDPADGILLGEDFAGDGDFSDDEDFLDVSADSNGNELVDSGALASGECVDYVVELVVPAGVAQDTLDELRVRARSSYQPSRVADNYDLTTVGAVVIHPDRDRSGLAGDTVDLPHEVCNHQAFTDTLDLLATDSQGWNLEFWSDPDGDGDPSDGGLITDTGPLAPDTCTDVVLRVTIPVATPAGTIDDITAEAVSQTDPAVLSEAQDKVTVAADRFTLTPDHDTDAGPGDTLYLPHFITNHGDFADTYTLSASSTLGSTLTFLTDPNGDGDPDDASVIPPGTPVGPVDPFGGVYQFLLKIETPAGSAFPDVDTITVTATSETDASTAQAIDTIHIQILLTYSDPLFARPAQDWFSSCATIYAQAHGLQTNATYRFQWFDPNGNLVRTGPEVKPDTIGRVDDSFTLGCDDPPGAWAVRLQKKSGSQWEDVPNAEATFNVLDDPGGEGGDIVLLETDRDVYNYQGDSVEVSSTEDNDTPADYLDTVLEYVLFADDDLSGTPNAGEPYILPDGTRGVYADGDTTHLTEGVDVLSGETYDDFWQVDNADFQTQGEWCVWERWATTCDCGNTTIDTELTCFLVSCFPNPDVDAGSDREACEGDAVALDDATSDGDTHLWDDGGAGGTFSPSPDVLNPTYSNPAAGTYTLTLTSTFTGNGCEDSDTLVFTVDPLPAVDAGADKDGCAGEDVPLDDASQSGGDTFSWDDGGAGGTFSPSPDVLNPTYSNPNEGDYTLTLTVTDSSQPTQCSADDTVLVSITLHPAVDAGADKEVCAGAPVDLDDATQSGGDTFSWDDGGAGGTFAPSPDVLNPSYSNPVSGTYALTLVVTDTSTPAECSDFDTLVVTVSDAVADAGADQSVCDGGTALLDGSGSTVDNCPSGPEYQWRKGADVIQGWSTDPDVEVTPGTDTTYTLDVRCIDSPLCEDSDEVLVTVGEVTADAGEDPKICEGDTTTLDGSDSVLEDCSGDPEYRWSEGGNVLQDWSTDPTLDVTPADDTLYTLEIRCSDEPACTDLDEIEVTVVIVTPEAGADQEICSGGSTLIDGSGSTVDDCPEGLEYRWRKGSTVIQDWSEDPDRVVNPGATTTYSLDARCASMPACEQSDDVTVTVSDPVADAGPDEGICAGDCTTLDGSGSSLPACSGAAEYRWLEGAQEIQGWSTDPTTQVCPGSTTIYTLQVRCSDEPACMDADTVEITVTDPDADAGADQSICGGESAVLDGSGSTVAGCSGSLEYRWLDGGNVVQDWSTDPTATVNPADTTTYTLEVRCSTAPSCLDADGTVVTVVGPSADAGPDQAICSGGSALLDGSGSSVPGCTGFAQYRWRDGATVIRDWTTDPQTSVDPTADTNYSVDVRCSTEPSCVDSDDTLVALLSDPVADFVVDPAQLCVNDDACFNNLSTGADTYLWDFGTGSDFSNEVDPCHAWDEGGTYTVTLTASNACGSSTHSEVVNVDPVPTAEFSYSTQGNKFCKDKAVQFTDESTENPISWQWDFGDGNTSTQQDPSHTYTTDGVFLVSLVACNDCGCSEPHYEEITILPTCQSNCEANSNQIPCEDGQPTTIDGDTCLDHDNFNTSSYPCASDYYYSGENKTYDLNYTPGSNYIITIEETGADPDSYELDLMISQRCNPPDCVAWGDDQVTFQDYDSQDYFLIVDGRDGTCGPYTLTVQCLTPSDTDLCTPPLFDGILDAADNNACFHDGILVTWDPVFDWGTGTDGAPCDSGTYEVLRAPISDPDDFTTIASGLTSLSHLDDTVVPDAEYVYRVNARNDCCGEGTDTDEIRIASDRSDAEPEFDGIEQAYDLDPCLDTGVQLLWSPADFQGASGTYRVRRAAGPDCNGPVIASGLTGTGYVDESGTNGVEYYYRIEAVNECGSFSDGGVPCLPASDDVGAPAAFNGVQNVFDLDPCADSGVRFTWNAVEDWGGGCDSGTYRVYRDGVLVASGLTELSWDDLDALDDVSYDYRVEAVNDCCGFGDGNTKTLPGRDATGKGPVFDGIQSAEDLDACALTGIQLTWNPVSDWGSGASGTYTVYRDGVELVSGLTDTEYVDDTAAEGVVYSYRVVAVNDACGADDGNTKTLDAADDASGPPVFDGIQSADDRHACAYTGTELAWNPVTDWGGGCASGTYTVYRDGQVHMTGLTAAEVDDLAAIADQEHQYRVVAINDCCAVEDGNTETLPATDAGGGIPVFDGIVSADDLDPCAATGIRLGWNAAEGWGDCSSGTYRVYRDGQVVAEGLTVTTWDDLDTTPGVEYSYAVQAVDDCCGNEDPNEATLEEADLVEGTPVFDGIESVTDPDPCAETGVDIAWNPVSDWGGGCSSGTYRVLRDGAVIASGLTTTTYDDEGGDAGVSYDYRVEAINDCCAVSDGNTETLPGIDQTAESPVFDGVKAAARRPCDPGTIRVSWDDVTDWGGGCASGTYTVYRDGSVVAEGVLASPWDDTTAGPGPHLYQVFAVDDCCDLSDDNDVEELSSEPDPLVSEAGPDKTLTCDATFVILEGSSSGGDCSLGCDPAWDPAGSVSDPAVFQPEAYDAALYTLTVTDAATGCSDTDTVTVDEDSDRPIAEAGPARELTCTEPEVVLEGSATGGSGSYDYHWEPASDVSDPDIAQPTTSIANVYTLTVTDAGNGCVDNDTVTVTQNQDSPTAEAGPDKTLTCAETEVTLDGSGSGGSGNYTYQWEPASDVSDPNIPNPTTSTPGNYTLTITDTDNGCTSSDSVTVGEDTAPPTADAGPDKTITCSVPTAHLEGSGSGGSGDYAYQWEPAGDVSDPNLQDPDTGLPGVYTLTVTDNANGCSSSDTAEVVDGRDAPAAEAGPDKALTCAQIEVTLEGSASGGTGDYDWSWQPQAPVSDPFVPQPTTQTPGGYTLTVTDAGNGCVDTDAVDVLDDTQPPTVNAGADQEVCEGTIIPLSDASSTGDDHLWDDGGAGGVFTPSPDVLQPDYDNPSPGIHTLTLASTSSANACSAEDTVEVRINALPTVEAGSDKVGCAGAAVLLSDANQSGGTEVAWDDGGAGGTFSPSPNVLRPSYTHPTAGSYLLTLTVTDASRPTACASQDTVTVTVEEQPVADAGTDKSGCEGEAIPLDDAGQTGGDEFLWSDGGAGGAFSPSATVLRPTYTHPTAGVYILTLTVSSSTSQAGCEDVDTVSIVVNAPPTADAGADASVCEGDDLSLGDADQSGGDTFSWDDGGAGGVFSPSPNVLRPIYRNPVPGTYTLTLEVSSSGTGCLATDSRTVTVDPVPVVEAGGNTEICQDGSAALDDADQIGGDIFEWDDGGAGGVFSPSPNVLRPSYQNPIPGSYVLTLTVSDSATGCVASDQRAVTVNPLPVVDAGADRVSCLSSAVDLAGASQTGGDVFLWSDGGAGGTFSPSANVLAPIYTAPATGVFQLALTVTNSLTGCAEVDALRVEILEDPLAEAGPGKTLDCQTTSVTLEGSGAGGSGDFSYAWEPAADVSDPTIPRPTTSVAGTYTLTVTDQVTGCVAVDTIVVDQKAELPVVDAGPNRTLTCDEPSTILEATVTGGTGSYAYDWAPAADVSDPAILRPTTSTPGTYTLTVTDQGNGCVVQDVVEVIDDTEPPVADAGPDQTLDCSQATVTLLGSASGGNASQGYLYAWEPAADVSDPSIAQPTTGTPGTYTLTVRSVANGCVATDTAEVLADTERPVADAGPDKTLTCELRTVTLEGSATGGTGSYAYEWAPAADVSDPAVAQPTTSTGGVYILTVTDRGNGCVASDTVTVTDLVASAPIEPSPLDLDPARTPLLVERDALGNLRLSWEATGFHYDLYRGTLAALDAGGYDHGAFGSCDLASPLTVVSDAAGSHYFLAVSRACSGPAESSYGRASSGAERPDAQTASGNACP